MDREFILKINEIAVSAQAFLTDDMKEDILADCSNILKVYKKHPGKFFYRGAKDFATQWQYQKASPNFRRTVDTGDQIQFATDQSLRKLGARAFRENSTFATSQLSSAAYYGSLYIVFPIDGFRYTWSPLIRDFYSDFVYEHGRSEALRIAQSPELLQQVFNYQFDKGLDKALLVGHEIMIHGNYYRVRCGTDVKVIPLVNAWIQSL